ncbi:MAG: pilus assembly FimT family protein, partial [Thermoanaerobaculia bacterium]
ARRAPGTSLVEALVLLAIVALVMVATVPPVLAWAASVRLRHGAAEVASVLRLARSEAARRSTNVGIKFTIEEDGDVAFRLHRDGDGDGVRSSDIASGIDPALSPPRRLLHLGAHVRFGFPPGPAPRDPADPRRRLDDLDDPIRFNRSDLAVFSPLGESTPGSAYLTDSLRGLAAVRLFGRTGKVKVLVYDPDGETWRLD